MKDLKNDLGAKKLLAITYFILLAVLGVVYLLIDKGVI